MTLDKPPAADERPVANLEAEAAMLGAMMIDASCIDGVLNICSPDDMFEPLHQRIFSAVASMHAAGTRPTPVTLAPLFKDDPAIIHLGGPGYLATLTGSGAQLIGVYDFARQLTELAARRRLIESLSAVIEAAKDTSTGTDAPEIYAQADEAINTARGASGGISIIDPTDMVDQIAEEMGKEVHGVTTALIPDMNRALGKLRNGNLIVIAGRPGMGKSAVATSYALGAAMNGHGTLFVSLEMSGDELAARMISDLCYKSGIGVPHTLIRDRIMKHPDHWDRFEVARQKLRGLPIRLIDTTALTVPRLIGIARQTARRFEAKGHKLELLIVDYLQLLRGVGRQDNRVAEVSEISRGLKEAAKVLGIPIIALAQLSRAVEQREDRRPRLSDLRESGAIEQDADTIGFLYRHEYYLQGSEPERDTPKHIEWQQQMEACKNVLEIIAGKLRHGRTGTQELRFYGEYQAVRGREG